MIKAKGNPASGYGKPRFGGGMGELWQRATIAAAVGINISDPVDQLDVVDSPLIRNMRSYGKSQLITRPGLVNKATLPNVHSIIQLQDEVLGKYPFFYGSGEELFIEDDLVNSIADGFSGNPMTFAIARPSRSANPWLYVADDNKMIAVDSDGNVRNWGIAPPIVSPTLTEQMLGESLVITDCLSLTEGNTWNKSVCATTLSVVNRLNTTISQILYDTGSTGWALIVPATFNSAIQVNTRISINGSFCPITQILPAIENTAVESIAYHTSSTGKATVQLTTPVKGLQPNSLVMVGTEIVRVLEVIDGLDHKPCFVANFVMTHGATELVTGMTAFRTYTTLSHSIGQSLVIKAFESIIDPTSSTPEGIGNIRLNLDKDLSLFPNRPVNDEDEIHIGIYVSDINRLQEGRIWLDVDANTTTAYSATDLSRNYYFYAFRPDDLQAIADFNQAASLIGGTPGRIQKATYDQYNSGPVTTVRDNVTGQLVGYDYVAGQLANLESGLGQVSTGVRIKEGLLEQFRKRYGLQVGADGRTLFQIGSGKEQWYQLTIKLKDLERVGEDKSKTLKDVKSVMVNFQVTKTNPNTTVTVGFSSWWISGGYNLDSYASRGTISDAYYYRYTGYNEETGDESLPSPPTRIGLVARRQKNKITLPAHPDSQCNKLRLYRWGGTLLQWLRVATVDNIDGVQFEDDLADESIANNPPLTFDKYAPVPSPGLPVKGYCNVFGNRVVWVSGDKFDLSWATGNEITINGKTHLLYAQPYSDVVLELTASAGSATNVEFYLNSPIKLGQPIGRVFGPYGAGAEALTYFFVGDPINPGYLYWTNPDDPNCSVDGNYIEISSPNEPLLNGVIYDGRVFVASSERLWQVVPSRMATGASGFAAQEVANSRGIVSPWAFFVDKIMYQVSKDGIYASEGGQPTNLTNEKLQELFPHDGIAGTDFDGIKAVSFENDNDIRLMAYSGKLYFDHKNTAGEYQTLILDTEKLNFLYDQYLDGGVRCRYGVQGQRAGDYNLVCATETQVGTLSNPKPLDYGVSFDYQWTTLAFGAEERRAEKLIGDYSFNYQSDAVTDLTIESYANSFSDLIQSDVTTLELGRKTVTHDYPIDTFILDVGYKIKGNSTERVQFFNVEPSLLLRPERASTRATDWDDCGITGSKLIQGVYIEADTQGEQRLVEVVGDDNVVIQTLSINHDGQQRKVYSFESLTPTMLVRLVPKDMADWRLYDVSWIAISYPDKATTWQTANGLDLGFCGWKHIADCYVDMISTADSVLTITIDNIDYTYTIPSTDGKIKRNYLRLHQVKGKLFAFKLTSSEGIRLFGSSCFHIGDYGRSFETPYRQVNPFGSELEEGATI